MMRTSLKLTVLGLFFGLVGCGGSDGAPITPVPQPGEDAQAEVGTPDSPGQDSAPEVGPETGPGNDAGEGGVDAQPEAQPEAGEDAAQEAQPEAAMDSGCGTPAECAALAEQKASDKLAAVAGDDAALKDFLTKVPKGGDLHHHLSGAVYAETYLEWAKAEGGYCINTGSSNYLSLSYNCGSSTVPVPSPGESLYSQVVAEWSMEGFVPSSSESGHDHFFATFGKFGAISGAAHRGKMLADVKRRAANENQVYIELMLTANSTAQDWGGDEWSAHHGSSNVNAASLPTFYSELMASSGLNGAQTPILENVVDSETEANQILGCAGSQPEPGCKVASRYVVYISRSGTLAGVFAQLVAAYEAGIKDPRVVAVNLVGPEDGSSALSRYDLHMSMLEFLYNTYRVTNKSPLRLTLHAGELAPKYTPSSYDIATINHVRKALQIAHADRIGHGVDILLESDPEGLLTELDQKNVLVEICLSSNIQILEVSGTTHPLASYISHGVPVALATDDQAVSRSSMAGEYFRAVRDQQLDYRRLKTMARDSLEHSFVPGSSLWVSFDTLQAVSECAPTQNTYLGDDPPPAACATVLAGSERARLQWELERRFRVFEASQ